MPSQKVNLFLSFCGFVCVSSMDDVWVELRAPRFVVHGHSATLKCNHNVDPETLYKVVFFKNGQRIVQYVQGRDPPFELFNFTGAYINLIQMDSTSITLDKMDFPASGTYACEIALEIPLYSKASKVQEVNVIVQQKHRPKIKVKHKNKKFSSQDDLVASCQSAPSYPAPHLTWLINDEKVDESLTIPHGTVLSNRYYHGMPLSQTNSTLILPLNDLQLLSNEAIVITCLSTIPSYAYLNEGFADIQNHTITVNVRVKPTPPQLPFKIVRPETSRSTHILRYNAIVVIIIAIANLNV